MKKLSLILLFVSFIGNQVFALETDRPVAPQIFLGGRIISTMNFAQKDGYQTQANSEHNEIDFADSSLLLGFEKRMYRKGVAGAVFGLTKPEEYSDSSSDIFFHQMKAYYRTKTFSVSLGRTNIPSSTLIEFPTLRDDDLMSYTHVGNASSYAENAQYQLYGNVFSMNLYLGKNVTLSGWSGSRFETDTSGVKKEIEKFNSGGLGLTYGNSEDLQYVKRLRHAGIWVDYQSVENDDTSTASTTDTKHEGMTSVIAGAEFNLNMNPVNNWSMAIQYISNSGLSDATADSDINLLRAKSDSIVMSLRYKGRPRLLTRFQGALTLAYKNYSETSNTSQYSIIPSMVYRLGAGFDLVTQYSYTAYQDGLASLKTYSSEQKFQIGFVFYFDAKFNDNTGERNSILNVEHGYIN
ncbi:MAG: hypothetical protein ACI86H_001988 [bacterium]|jgi:hypothetical protein